MKEKTLVLRDGHPMFYRVWEAEKPVATVHINHGMAEHSLRYDRFAVYLNSLGFTVYAQDHRGHGYTMQEGEQGWFADNDGWNVVVADAWEIDQLIASEHPGLPHFLFGHSMGSFMARTELERYSEAWKAAVICGTGASQGIKGSFGKALARHRAKKNGGKKADELLNTLSFSSYVTHFKEEAKVSTSVWLSRDPEEVAKYDKDPLCGFTCSTSFFADLVDGINYANSPEEIAKIRKDIPLLIISGDEDPVGNYGKGVRKVAELYRDAGIKDVRLELRKGGRHEILNETDREETMRIISGFYLSVLAGN